MNGADGVTRSAREAVLHAARELNYVPHAAARALSTGRTRTIAVLLPDMHGAFFSELIRELDQCAHAHGQSLLVASLHGRLAEAPKVFALIHGQVDGVILMAPFVDADRRLAELPFTVPTVLLNAPGPVGDAPAITVDNAGGASQVAQHFALLGYKDVVHIAGPADNFDAAERARGFHAAARSLGMRVQRDIRGNYSEEAGREAGAYLATRVRKPRAVFAANDNMAVGCLEALASAGVAVPDEIAVAGFDDIPTARFTTPPLTTVRPPVAQQGLEAFEWLVAAINRKGRARLPPSPGTQPLPTTLIVRRSTDPAAILPTVRAEASRTRQGRV
jgi:LacI family transcriptional regulator